MEQAFVFDDWRDAARHIVSCLGGAKAVGSRLRSDFIKPDHAARWLNDCLNPDRRENLSPENFILLLKLAREGNCHAAMEYVAMECGYQPPKPMDPEEERDALMRAYHDNVDTLRKLTERMEMLAERDELLHAGVFTGAGGKPRAVR